MLMLIEVMAELLGVKRRDSGGEGVNCMHGDRGV